MNIMADTNVLVRAVVADEQKQTRAALEALSTARIVAVSAAALCELVWVLSRGYRIANGDIAAAIRTLMSSDSVEADRATIEAGLANLENGGDFADGVIAHEGAALGGDVFVTFDKSAVKRLEKLGFDARLLA